jgi:hypothetical protein
MMTKLSIDTQSQPSIGKRTFRSLQCDWDLFSSEQDGVVAVHKSGSSSSQSSKNKRQIKLDQKQIKKAAELP